MIHASLVFFKMIYELVGKDRAVVNVCYLMGSVYISNIIYHQTIIYPFIFLRIGKHSLRVCTGHPKQVEKEGGFKCCMPTCHRVALTQHLTVSIIKDLASSIASSLERRWRLYRLHSRESVKLLRALCQDPELRIKLQPFTASIRKDIVIISKVL